MTNYHPLHQRPPRQHPEPVEGELAKGDPAEGRPTKRHTLSLLLLLGILLLAAALRLTRLDLAEFKSDEAGIARAALALVHEGQFPVVGPSSSQGPAHPPLQIYLMALPFAITQDPRLAVAVVALIHAAAVLMAYLLGARFFKRRVGLIAALLFAVNPWAIYYARKIWTQNWPLATTLFIFSLLLLVVERRPWALVGASLALVALAGTHLGGLAFIVVLVLVLLLFPSGVKRRPALVAALLFVLFAAPYIYHDACHDWQSLRGLFDPDAGQVQVDLEAARFATWLTSGYHYQDLAGARHVQFLEGLPNLRWLDVVEMVLLGAGLVYLIARIIRHALRGRERWRGSAGRDVVLLSWLLIPVLLQTRHSQPVYPHYFILLYPVQYLVIALMLSEGLDWLRPRLNHRLGRWCLMGLVGLVIAIGAWQVYLEQSFVRFVARYDTPGGYGPVVGPLWRTASIAGDTAAADGAEILVVAQGDNPVWDNLPSAFDVLLPRHLSHRFVDGQKALVFPQGPTVYITTPEVEDAAAILQQQTGAALVEQIDAPGEQRLRVFRRENASRDDVLQGMTPLEPPQRLANNVELLAYAVEDELRPGGTLHFTLAWWLDGPPPLDADYHTFAHLVDVDGERFGQHDLSSFASASWQTGDLVLATFQIEVDAAAPPGEYWIRVGMYSYPDIVNVPVVDVAGNAQADSVVIGPILLP
jgi:4-amino-4-deoxy-L-arabinose transferase-like glycosyltransferase